MPLLLNGTILVFLSDSSLPTIATPRSDPWFLLVSGALTLFWLTQIWISLRLRKATTPAPDPILQNQLQAFSAELGRFREELQWLAKSSREESQNQRQELQTALSLHRNEAAQGAQSLHEGLQRSSATLSAALSEKIDLLTHHLQRTLDAQNEAWNRFFDSQQQASTNLRQELTATRQEITQAVQKMSADSQASLQTISEKTAALFQSESKAHAEAGEKLRTSVETRLVAIQSAADAKLEQMRLTVDDKLSSTLSHRLGESFKLVSDRLEAVQQGFGEMKSLAGNVTDLRRIMENVKTRGIWGEVQLGHLLEQLFSPQQYEVNFRPRPRSGEVVEFAIKLPGTEASEPVYLPIDSKFPLEDYLRIVQASEAGQSQALQSAQKELEKRIYSCATDIRNKYIVPPATTNFAVLFLPTEALYAEVIKIPGLLEDLTRNYKVIVQGPTTFSAFVMALLMGFRTLSIQKRSSEIDKLLGAIRQDFGKFTDLLGKVEEKLDDAKTNIGKARLRGSQIVRRLGKVELLPEEQTAQVLPDPERDPDVPPELVD
jgi:DNA recombination protein RmuC